MERKKNYLVLGLQFITRYFIGVLVLIVVPPLYLYRTIGKKKIKGLKRESYLVVSNHCYYLDVACIGCSFFPRYLRFSADEETTKNKVIGFILKSLLVLPIRTTNLRDFGRKFSAVVKKKKILHFFPEGIMLDYNQEVADFKSGAILFAFQNNIPVVPFALVLKTRPILKFLTKPFPWITGVVGDPLYCSDFKSPDRSNSVAINNMSEALKKSLQELIDSHGGDKSLFRGKIKHKI